ncbi:MAG: peptidylprolyl isomerase [Sphingomicrobium sp.]
MLSSLRRLSKTKPGMLLIAFPFMMIIGGFVVADMQNFGSGNIGLGGGGSALVTVGDQRVSDSDISEAMQRRLEEVRRENPDADYATIAGDFDALLKSLIDQKTLIAFAGKSDFVLSKRLIDAEIAQLPRAQGLNGKFSDQAYQGFLAQRRLTDAQVRELIKGGLLQRLLLAPVASNARASVGMATPYASMLLEAREGQVAAVPIETFLAGLKPSDADIQKFYAANRARYTIPEQRVLRFARLGPESVASVTASAQEITDYYKANSATYAATDTRNLSQAVVQDRRAAEAIAARVKGGANLAAAAGPGAAVSTLAAQTRENYTSVAGKAAADAVFAGASGAVIGPIQSDFGWTVTKVDSIARSGGKSLEAARSEIGARLIVDKRKAAIEDKADQLQNAVDDGANFAEAAKAAGLEIGQTPLITATGQSLAERGFKIPAGYQSVVKTGFEIAANDPPDIVALPNGGGYVMVAPGDIIPAAPPPLASIRPRVAADWVVREALKRAKTTADAIVAKVGRGVPLAQAMRETGANLPPSRPIAARRMQITAAETPVPEAIQTLFFLTAGKARAVAAPGGRGFFVVTVDKIVPGNATLQPALIARMQSDLQGATSDAYAQQFIAAAGKSVGIERNAKAIAEARKRITAGSN